MIEAGAVESTADVELIAGVGAVVGGAQPVISKAARTGQTSRQRRDIKRWLSGRTQITLEPTHRSLSGLMFVLTGG